MRDSLGNARPLALADETYLLPDDGTLEDYWVRARARRKRRRKRARRRFRNFRKKWRKWWRGNWAKFLRVVNKIGGMLLKLIPVVGPIISTLAELSVEACITSGEVLQAKIKAGKAVGEAALDGFKAYMEKGAPDGVAGVIYRVQTKYELPEGYPAANLLDVTSNPVVAAQSQALENLAKLPQTRQLLEFEERLEEVPEGSPEADALEKEVDALDDIVLPQAIAIEKALDAEYWRVYPPLRKADPKGGGKYAKPAGWGKLIDAYITSLGDWWVRWKGPIEKAPEGTTADIWYPLTGGAAATAIHATATDSRESVMAQAARERDEKYGCCWERVWDPRAKKFVWRHHDPGGEARMWARVTVLSALGLPIPDEVWEGGEKKLPPKRKPPPPWLACPSGLKRAQGAVTQLQSTFNAVSREQRLGIPAIRVSGTYDAATESLLKRVFAAKRLPAQIEQGTVRANFERLGYSKIQAEKWEDSIAYFKRRWREEAEGLRGKQKAAAMQGKWRGEGKWAGYACQVYSPAQFEVAQERYRKTQIRAAPRVLTAAVTRKKVVAPPSAPVLPSAVPTMVAPPTVMIRPKEKLPKWVWALVGAGTVFLVGGGVVLVTRAKRSS